ncbi:hypothetical protein KNO15_19250 [Leifsonia shinshuensis]|uniref:hypothetical protein n=1 Tax=Leifsonia shinshuensis TaxID=150026 RepID=UPI001F50B3E6|nr:hypothetical protein [Leifsonia shinshuensis]MCI0158843.1 hypothetical protein [Leifsonia shinshuensis]
MSRPRGKSRAALAVPVLLGLALTGCTQAGMCGQDIRPSPLVSVDAKPWIAAHPDTDVRVCAEGNCTDGSSVVATYGALPTTPFHDGDSIEVTVQPIQGSTTVESFTTTARLVDGQCGQWGARLKLDGDGTIAQEDR